MLSARNEVAVILNPNELAVLNKETGRYVKVTLEMVNGIREECGGGPEECS